jgi:coenzyme F420 hydrogenase subunit beta
VKTFADLETEVVSKGICGACGGCVSFCSAGNLNALEQGADGLPCYADEASCLSCGICHMICPVTSELLSEVRSRFGWRRPIGAYQAISSARAADEAIRAVATDGGVVTALLLYMLDRRTIHGAVVSRRKGTFGREATIAVHRDDLIAAAGSQFARMAQLEGFGEQYTTFCPTVSAVKGLARPGNVALVGTPCQVNTVRKMQALSIVPADIISHVIGLFCMENFSFYAPAGEKLAAELGIGLADIAKLNIKEDVIVTVSDGSEVHVPFERMDGLARPACLACTEFANDFADISVGGLGSPQGYTTVLIRSDAGRRIYAEALRAGYIEERGYRDGSEAAADRARMLAKVVALARRKQDRGGARLRQLGAT